MRHAVYKKGLNTQADSIRAKLFTLTLYIRFLMNHFLFSIYTLQRHLFFDMIITLV